MVANCLTLQTQHTYSHNYVNYCPLYNTHACASAACHAVLLFMLCRHAILAKGIRHGVAFASLPRILSTTARAARCVATQPQQLILPRVDSHVPQTHSHTHKRAVIVCCERFGSNIDTMPSGVHVCVCVRGRDGNVG